MSMRQSYDKIAKFAISMKTELEGKGCSPNAATGIIVSVIMRSLQENKDAILESTGTIIYDFGEAKLKEHGFTVDKNYYDQDIITHRRIELKKKDVRENEHD